VNGGKEKGNPSKFAPSRGGRHRSTRAYEGASSEPGPRETLDSSVLLEPGWGGDFAWAGAWLRGTVRLPNITTLHPTSLVTVDAGHQTGPSRSPRAASHPNTRL
jgi:hypothetical protein